MRRSACSLFKSYISAVRAVEKRKSAHNDIVSPISKNGLGSRSLDPLFQHQEGCSHSVMCYASKAKKMADSQLNEARHLAEEGKMETNQGELKLPGDDHGLAIQEALLEKAKTQTEKAVENLRHNFSRRHQKVEASDESGEAKKDLNKEAEQSRAAIRKVRQKLMQELGKMERESELSSDEQHRLANSLQRQIDTAVSEVDTLVDAKLKDLTSV